MAQIFRPRANVLARWSIPAMVGGLAVLYVVAVAVDWSPWESERQVVIDQPVKFSHEHHVSGLGIDCRYCHASVEVAASAGMPPTHTCMSCHSQVWTESDMLRPVRASYRTEQPIQWNRVHNLPDYVYFNHSIHVTNGVGCETCHGRVDQMPLMYRAETLYMQWCLDCHRNPEQYLRPEDYIYAFGYDLPDDEQEAVGLELIDAYDIDVGMMTQCSVCHR